MGVRGLTTYIASNEDLFLKEYFLNDCNLIIDGHSLCAQLYKQLGPYSAFGGDYDKFSIYVKKFFKILRKCHITPYVLFDGGLEDIKIKTALNRLRSKLFGAHQLYPGNQDSMQIFPLLMRDVFKQTLKELNIEFTVCEFEADDEIAALARLLDCPVLSYDSDFYIYNVKYIPYPCLEHEPVKLTILNHKTFALKCKIYKTDFFLEHFNGLKEEVLPLLATLLGNDYIKKTVFTNFFSHLKLPKSKIKQNDQQRSIRAVLDFLKDESLDSAVDKILGRVKKMHKKNLAEIIEKCCNVYRQTFSESLKYFNLDIQPFEHAVIKIKNPDKGSNDSDSNISTSNGDTKHIPEQENTDLQLPEWFKLGVRKGYISQPIINIYTHHIYLMIPQAEDYRKDDAFLPCIQILRYSFDLLTNFSHDNLMYFTREGRGYRKHLISTEYSIQRPPECNENCFDDWLNVPNFIGYFLNKTLKIDSTLIFELPSSLQLYMISVLWWVKHCVYISEAHLYAIFMTYIMINVIDEKIGVHRVEFSFQNKFAKKIEEIKSGEKDYRNINDIVKNKVTYNDCLLAADVLIKQFDMDEKMRHNPKIYDSARVHAFAQFQCCLQQMNYLNGLSGYKLPATEYHKTYNGTFVYNIYNHLMNREHTLDFLEKYLNGAHSVLSYFKVMLEKFRHLCECCNIEVPSSVVWKKRKHRNRKKIVDFEVDLS